MESIKKTAKFWSQFLRKTPRMDAGDTRINMIAEAIQTFSEKPSVSEESIRVFESCIEKIISENLKEDPEGIFIIDVDYHPDETLRRALKESEINIGFMGLPWKTMSWTTKDSVQVRQGYGAEITTL